MCFSRFFIGLMVSLVLLSVTPIIASAASHKVSPGESLFLISETYGITVDELKTANSLQTSMIQVDMILTIPVNAVDGERGNEQVVASRGAISGGRPSAAEVDLLARLITAEADGENYLGKVAVGAVVLNRLDDRQFPKTIKDVIYQYDHGVYQFEPVMNGQIDKPASSQSLEAAYDALNGADPTKGALYFFVGSKVKNKWLWARPQSLVIGDVVFTY